MGKETQNTILHKGCFYITKNDPRERERERDRVLSQENRFFPYKLKRGLSRQLTDIPKTEQNQCVRERERESVQTIEQKNT